MAELFGRVDGCCRGRGGSMHMFDLERRFMGGYGIVGGNLPIAAGIALASDYSGRRRGDAVHVRRRRLQPGHVRRDAQPRRAVAAAGRLHGHQQPVRHGHRAAAPLGGHRPAAQGREPRRAGDALRRDGRRSTPTRSSARRVARVREERRPLLVEAVTYRFRGHSMADPEQYRSQGGGRALARARPDRRRSARCSSREGVIDAGRARADRRGGDRARRRGRRVRRRLAVPRARVALRRRLRARRRGARAGTRSRPPRSARRRAQRGEPRAQRRPGAGRQRRDPPAADRCARRRRGRRASRRRRGALMAEMRYREALGAALREELRRDERVILMGEDIGVFGGAFKVTDGPARGVRREARARHADLREHDRRRWAWARR